MTLAAGPTDFLTNLNIKPAKNFPLQLYGD